MIPLLLLRPNSVRPRRATGSSAAYDLHYCAETPGIALSIPAGRTSFVGTGIALSLDTGVSIYTTPMAEEGELHFFPTRNMAAFILPRSGLGCRGLAPGNSPGLIDPDYRGEIRVCLRNDSNEHFLARDGDRIAQILFIPFLTPDFLAVPELPESSRGPNGFGSTGK